MKATKIERTSRIAFTATFATGSVLRVKPHEDGVAFEFKASKPSLLLIAETGGWFKPREAESAAEWSQRIERFASGSPSVKAMCSAIVQSQKPLAELLK